MSNFRNQVINNPLNGDFWKQKDTQIVFSDFLRNAGEGPANDISYGDFKHQAGRGFLSGSGYEMNVTTSTRDDAMGFTQERYASNTEDNLMGDG